MLYYVLMQTKVRPAPKSSKEIYPLNPNPRPVCRTNSRSQPSLVYTGNFSSTPHTNPDKGGRFEREKEKENIEYGMFISQSASHGPSRTLERSCFNSAVIREGRQRKRGAKKSCMSKRTRYRFRRLGCSWSL